jgi:hypothetical protein
MQNHPSAAKAPLIFSELVGRINPSPFKTAQAYLEAEGLCSLRLGAAGVGVCCF